MEAQTKPDLNQTLKRLSQASVRRNNDPYNDIDWDGLSLEATDPGLVLPPSDPIAQHEWYGSLNPEMQAKVGLLRIVASLRTAWHFENILQQGLLHRALYLPEGTEEFRYIHHEMIEESQHTLMFEELIRRSGYSMRGMPWWLRHVAAWLMRVLSRHSPVVFFSMVLAGEEPLDKLQRETLEMDGLHPLVRQIMAVHVAEEARHISYARSAIRDEAARLSRFRRQTVAFFTPIALAIMVHLMVRPTHDLCRGGIPSEVLRDVYRSPAGHSQMVGGVARIRSLLSELGLVTKPARFVWRLLGIWQ